MIEAYDAGTAPSFELYGLGLEHKHVPELQKYARLTRRPIFVPSVAAYYKGMLVSVPLHLDTLPGSPSPQDIEAALRERYQGSDLVRVVAEPTAHLVRLEAEALNDTDKLELFVFGKPELNQAVLIARLDNLGKGAAGAAVQNIKLMLGLS
jgi:N-acetyl-gamma-glutamyl-phosphate reductase